MNDNVIWNTTDLGLAAYLVTKGQKLTTLNKNNPKRVSFGFVNSQVLQGLVDSYTSNGEVPAFDFYSNIKSLKARLLIDL